MRTILRTPCLLLLAVFSTSPLAAAPIFFGDRVEIPFTTPEGISGRVSVLFENVTNLDGAHFQFQVFDLPDPGLLAPRLNPDDPPGQERRFIPAAFPIKFKLMASSGFQFQGRWQVELRTEHLEFTPFTPLRLFRAPDDGFSPFVDITESVGEGSFRVGGFGGTFSEFVVAADLRALRDVVEDKIADAKGFVAAHSGVIAPGVKTQLETLLTNAATAHDDEDFALALQQMAMFIQLVEQQAGTGIPNTFDADAPSPISVAGELRGIGAGLRLGLEHRRQLRPLGTGAVQRRLVPGPGLLVDVEVTFAETFEIDLEELEVEAEVVNPAALVGRLPPAVEVHADFPVLVRINPSSSDLQAFAGAVEVELRTPNLDFGADSSLRLFKAPDGGPFEEISSTLALGSFRVGGFGGTFSEFMILRDLRPLGPLGAQRLQRLQDLLDDHAGVIDAGVLAELQADLTGASGFYGSSDYDGAIGAVDSFLGVVRRESGNGIPNVWANQGVRVNVAALLTSEASAFRLNLVVQRVPPDFDPADANRDGLVDVDDVFYVISRVYPGT